MSLHCIGTFANVFQSFFIFNFLGEQVTVDDCVDWFPLIGFLANMHGVRDVDVIRHEQDTLCLKAVKETLNEKKLNEIGRNKWNLQPLNNSFLQSILNMVDKMKDTERILLILYTIFCQSPEGADQLEAIEECYSFVIKNERHLKSKANSAALADKIKCKYPIIKAQHQLHLYGLYEDDLSALITNPIELIKAIYNRPIVFSATSKLNLNQVAEEFAKLFNLNYREIQISLLREWLALKPREETNGLDQTFCDNDLNSTILPMKNEDEINDEAVARYLFVIQPYLFAKCSDLNFSIFSYFFASKGPIIFSNRGRKKKHINTL